MVGTGIAIVKAKGQVCFSFNKIKLPFQIIMITIIIIVDKIKLGMHNLSQVKVRSGDYLWRLARKRNQSVEDILAANPHLRSNPSLIFPDEYIALRS